MKISIEISNNERITIEIPSGAQISIEIPNETTEFEPKGKGIEESEIRVWMPNESTKDIIIWRKW